MFYYGHDSEFPGRQLLLIKASREKAFGHLRPCNFEDVLSLTHINVILAILFKSGRTLKHDRFQLRSNFKVEEL